MLLASALDPVHACSKLPPEGHCSAGTELKTNHRALWSCQGPMSAGPHHQHWQALEKTSHTHMAALLCARPGPAQTITSCRPEPTCDAVLGRVVGALVGRRHQRVHGACVDDAPPAGSQHAWQRRLGRVEGRAEADGKDGIPSAALPNGQTAPQLAGAQNSQQHRGALHFSSPFAARPVDRMQKQALAEVSIAALFASKA